MLYQGVEMYILPMLPRPSPTYHVPRSDNDTRALAWRLTGPPRPVGLHEALDFMLTGYELLSASLWLAWYFAYAISTMTTMGSK